MVLPFIISVPHCASRVPHDIRSTMALSDEEILESVDFGTAEIFGRIPALEKITARWSRLVVDPNRAPDRLDAKGVTAVTDYCGRPVFKPHQAPDPRTTIARVERYHRPYHAAIEEAVGNPDAIALIDGHSLNGTGPADAPDKGRKRKQVILSNNGDRNGQQKSAAEPLTCSPVQINLFKSAFEKQGLTVALNYPYQGGYIVRHYGERLHSTNRFAIQIELNQNLYLAPGDRVPETRRLQPVYRLILAALEVVATTLSSR